MQLGEECNRLRHLSCQCTFEQDGMCRRRFSAALKATCLSVGQDFTTGLIQPVFAASAALPAFGDSGQTSEHVTQASMVCTHL